MNGCIPAGLLVLHHCDVRACCNTDHLFLGTDRDNARDREQKGRGVAWFGETNAGALLTEDMVREARRRASNGETVPALAQEMGVNKWTLHDAVNGRNWGWLE